MRCKQDLLKVTYVFWILLLSLSVIGCQPEQLAQLIPPATEAPTMADTANGTTDVGYEVQSAIFDYNQRLGRGINLGNALEAPMEGAWGVVLQPAYFSLIKAAGFDSVRIPIRWSVYASRREPYTIRDTIFDRVDWAIEQAHQNDLAVVINVHHFDRLIDDPDGQLERFLMIWEQIAAHYQDYPDTVYFEILNEPHDTLTANRWNDYALQALTIIRETNPTRPVIIGPVEWNSISQLYRLELPEDDRNIIVTIHYYSPFQFTHQGAEWVDGSANWLGTPWTASVGQRQAVIEDFQVAVRWAEKENRPLYLGEFGAYSKADTESRIRWTEFVRTEAEKQGMSWAYWEFGAGFGVYDRVTNTWRDDLLSALVSNSSEE
ncbi:MAG: glycoside hydrolase family 5 protein [Chloroflexota bacterium]